MYKSKLLLINIIFLLTIIGITEAQSEPDFFITKIELLSNDPIPREGDKTLIFILEVNNSGSTIDPEYISVHVEFLDKNDQKVQECGLRYYSELLNPESGGMGGACNLDLPAGIYTVIMEIDDNNAYDELNENNNRFERIFEVVKKNEVCVDLDKDDQKKKGTTIGYDLNEYLWKTYDDKCISEKERIEYRCLSSGEDGWILDEIKYCHFKSICINGECKTQREKSCQDTDDGQNHFIKGTVTTYDPTIGENVYTDYCIKDPTTRVSEIAEYSCNNNKELVTDIIPCVAGCSEGSCNQLPEILLNCEGCIYDEQCILSGTSIEDKYCLESELVNILPVYSDCSFDNQCSTNRCVDGYCAKPSVFNSFFTWLKNLF